MNYKNSTIIKRIVAIVLVLILVAGYLPTQVIAFYQKNNTDDYVEAFAYETEAYDYEAEYIPEYQPEPAQPPVEYTTVILDAGYFGVFADGSTRLTVNSYNIEEPTPTDPNWVFAGWLEIDEMLVAQWELQQVYEEDEEELVPEEDEIIEEEFFPDFDDDNFIYDQSFFNFGDFEQFEMIFEPFSNVVGGFGPLPTDGPGGTTTPGDVTTHPTAVQRLHRFGQVMTIGEDPAPRTFQWTNVGNRPIEPGGIFPLTSGAHNAVHNAAMEPLTTTVWPVGTMRMSSHDLADIHTGTIPILPASTFSTWSFPNGADNYEGTMRWIGSATHVHPNNVFQNTGPFAGAVAQIGVVPWSPTATRAATSNFAWVPTVGIPNSGTISADRVGSAPDNNINATITFSSAAASGSAFNRTFTVTYHQPPPGVWFVRWNPLGNGTPFPGANVFASHITVQDWFPNPTAPTIASTDLANRSVTLGGAPTFATYTYEDRPHARREWRVGAINGVATAALDHPWQSSPTFNNLPVGIIEFEYRTAYAVDGFNAGAINQVVNANHVSPLSPPVTIEATARNLFVADPGAPFFGDDVNGDGTVDHPFATVAHAVTVAGVATAETPQAIIHVMNNLTQTATVNINNNQNIVVQAWRGTQRPGAQPAGTHVSMTRAATFTSGFTSNMIIMNPGAVFTMRDITLDGNNVPVGDDLVGGGPAINARPNDGLGGELNIEAGARIINHDTATSITAAVMIHEQIMGTTFVINMRGGEVSGNDNIIGIGIVSPTSSVTINMYDGAVISGNRIGITLAGPVTFNMDGGEISGNHNFHNDGTGNIGGVHVGSASTFNMSGGQISGNHANASGGGILLQGTAQLTGGIITGNTAGSSTFGVNGATPAGDGINVFDGASLYVGDLVRIGTANADNGVLLNGTATITQDGDLDPTARINVQGAVGATNGRVIVNRDPAGTTAAELAAHYHWQAPQFVMTLQTDWTATTNNAQYILSLPTDLFVANPTGAFAGNDTTGTGSVHNPWATVAHAVSQVPAGAAQTTIHVMDNLTQTAAQAVTIGEGQNIVLQAWRGTQRPGAQPTGTHVSITRAANNLGGHSITVTNGGQFTLRDLTLDGGGFSIGAAVRIESTAVGGDAIFNMYSGARIINHTVDNTGAGGVVSVNGGGLIGSYDALFNFRGGEISGNSAIGVFNNFATGVGLQSGNNPSAGQARARMYPGAIITNNHGLFFGGVTVRAGSGAAGAVTAPAIFTMIGGEITNNSYENAGFFGGGGVSIWGGTFIMEGGEISGNRAGATGGGINMQHGTARLMGGTITGNWTGPLGSTPTSGNTANAGDGVFKQAGTLEVGGSIRLGTSAADNGVWLNTNSTITQVGDFAPTARVNIQNAAGATNGRVIVNRNPAGTTAAELAAHYHWQPTEFRLGMHPTDHAQRNTQYILGPITHNVTFNLNGGNVGGVGTDVVEPIAHGSAIGTAVPVAVHSNHTLTGWQENGTGAVLTSAEVALLTVTAARNFTAVWRGITITLDTNRDVTQIVPPGTTAPTPNDNGTDIIITFPAGTPTGSGDITVNHPTGWTYEVTTGPGGEVVVTLRAPRAALTYDLNGGTAGTGPSPNPVTNLVVGTSPTLSTTAPTHAPSGTTPVLFVGWSAAPVTTILAHGDAFTAITQATVVAGGTTVYAIWGYDTTGSNVPDVLENAYSLTYDLNGGTAGTGPNPNPVTGIVVNTVRTLSTTAPTHAASGTTPVLFVGWSAAPVTTILSHGDAFTAITQATVVAGGTTVYAIWGYDTTGSNVPDVLENAYSLTYDLNGGTAGTGPNPNPVTGVVVNTVRTLSTTAPTHAASGTTPVLFVGWSAAPVTTVLAHGDSFTAITQATVVAGGTTVYAIWGYDTTGSNVPDVLENAYSLTYDLNGGTAGTGPNPNPVTGIVVNTVRTLSTTAPTHAPSGTTPVLFVGWSAAPVTTVLAHGDAFTAITQATVVAGGTTVYAIWGYDTTGSNVPDVLENAYSLTYDLNGGTAGTGPNPNPVTGIVVNTVRTLSTTAPTHAPSGTTPVLFVGWSAAPVTTVLAHGDSFTAITQATVVAGGTTVYAIWGYDTTGSNVPDVLENAYSLTYDLNGGNAGTGPNPNPVTGVVVNTVRTLSTTAPTHAPSGTTPVLFVGWSAAPVTTILAHGDAFTAITQATVVAGGTTVYAIWGYDTTGSNVPDVLENAYSLTYDLNGGTAGTGPNPNPVTGVVVNTVRTLSTTAPTHAPSGTTPVLFVGWSAAPVTSILSHGDAFTAITQATVVAGGTTVYAIWGYDTTGSNVPDVLENAYSLTYDLNGGTAGTGPNPNPVTGVVVNTVRTLSTTAPTHAPSGTTPVLFVGWSAAPVTTILASGDSFTAITQATVVAGGTTVYAIWGYDTTGSNVPDVLENAYSLTYDLNGGTAGTGPNPNPVTGIVVNTVRTLSTTAPTHAPSGTTPVLFVGWSAAPVTTILAHGDAFTAITQATVVAGGTTVYAIWGYDTTGSGVPDVLENAYSLTYDLNGGNAGTGPNPNPVTGVVVNTVRTLSTTAPTHAPSGTTPVLFVGWSAAPVTTILAHGDAFTAITQATVVAGGTTVYAIWGYDTTGSNVPDVLENAYSLTYDLNGGTAGTGPNPNPVTGIVVNTVRTLSTTAPTHAASGTTPVLFVGWSAAPVTSILSHGDSFTAITQATVVAGGTTVYAIWGYDTTGSGVPDVLENAYSLTYDLNGGNAGTGPNPNPVTGIVVNTVRTLSTTVPTHAPSGTTPVLFVGWSVAPVTSILSHGDAFTAITQATVVAGGTTVYAIWGYDTTGSNVPDVLENAYSLTYDLNGGTAGTGPNPNPVTGIVVNTVRTLSTTAPTHAASGTTPVLFVGWSAAPVTTILAHGDAFTAITQATVVAGGTTVYAIWGYDTTGSNVPDVLENAYSLTYDLNGGNAGTGPNPNPVTGIVVNTVRTLSTTAPTHAPSGTTPVLFVGWSAAPVTSILSHGNSFTAITQATVVAGGTTVYAIWGYDTTGSNVPDVLENAYSLTYDLNGGTAGTGPNPNPVTGIVVNTVRTLSTTAPTHAPSGTTPVLFVGWSAAPVTTILASGDSFTAITQATVVAGGTTVYAIWGYDTTGSNVPDVLENAYSLTYDLNGGTAGTGPNPNPVTGVVVNTVRTLSTTAPTHALSGTTPVLFVGWSAAPVTTILAHGDSFTAITQATVVAGGTTVYAIWGYDTTGSNVPDVLENATIVYNLNGGTAGTGPMPNPMTVLPSNNVALSTAVPSHPQAMHNGVLTDVVFIGWTSTQHATILPITGTLPARITTVDVAVNGTATVWALWGFDTNNSNNADIVERGTITYNINGGNAGTAPAPATVLAGANRPLSSGTPTHPPAMQGGIPTNVTFVGWSLTSPANILAAGATPPALVTAVDVPLNSNVNVYAVWMFSTAPQHTVTFTTAANGTINPGPTHTVQVTSGQNLTAAQLPTPQASSGFQFAGWFVGNTATNPTANPITGDITFQARFSVVQTPPTGSIYDLVINKQADTPHGGHVIIGHTVTYTISARNDGNASLNNIVIQDIIPAGMTLVPGSAVLRINNVVSTTIIPTVSGNTISWTVPSISAGDTVTATFQVTVDQMPNGIYERNFNNTATVAGRNTNTVRLTARRLVKNADRLIVNVGETLAWTLKGFHNPTTGSVPNFEILDMPGLGMNFQSGSLPAFTNGAGITYEIRYRVAGSSEWYTHATGINANAPFSFSLPQPGNIHYTAISIFFGTVPAGFALGNELVLTFLVTDDSPTNTLINRLFIRYDHNTEVEGGSPDMPTVQGREEQPQDIPEVTPVIPFSATHHAFVQGDMNGLVRPNDVITRAEVATIFFRLIDDQYRIQVWSQQNTFPDVNINNWFNNAVSTMANAGVFAGMPDGTFQPQRAITRAEFAVAMTRFFEGLPMEGANMFNDIEGHWAAAQINAAARMGWITGFPGGNFAPNQHITRAEAVALINRVLGRLPQSTADLLPGMITFADNMDTSAWFYLYIQEAANSNLFEMHENGINKTWVELIPSPDWRLLEQPNSTPQDILRD